MTGASVALPKVWRPGNMAGYMALVAAGAILMLLPVFLNAYLQSMLTKVLIFAIFALSLNLLTGYTGLFSVGHAAYFGVGAYTTAILLTRYHVGSFWLVALASFLLAALVAAFAGVIALRVKGIYFLLITLAIGQLLYSVAMKWRDVTGGSNGVTIGGYPDLGLPLLAVDRGSFYYLVLAVFAISFLLMHRVVHSPFGLALRGIREDEGRVRCLGFNTWLHKYIAFVIAGAFAGVAGMLFGLFNGFASPANLDLSTSVFVLLMVIIGSDRVFYGPVVGAIVVVLLGHFSSIYVPTRWPLILGAVFVLAVMFLRGGISIHLSKALRRPPAATKLGHA